MVGQPGLGIAAVSEEIPYRWALRWKFAICVNENQPIPGVSLIVRQERFTH